MAQAFGMSNAGTSSAGSSWINTLVARMPYTYKLLKNATEKNPKYELFDELLTRPTDRVRQQSVFQHQPEGGAGALMIDKRYHEIMYADVDIDKIRRVQEYRKMAAHAELAECLDEIADEAIVKDKDGDIVKCRFNGEMDRLIRESLEKEWHTFIQIYDLDNRGWELIRRFLTEGEVYFENVISGARPDYGIIGIVGIPTELVNPIYDNVYNQVISGFLLRKPIVSPTRNVMNQAQEELIPLDRNQVTYIHSGLWNEDNTIRLPYIENSRRAYKQLSLVEDSIIIYRLVRAPERLVFKVDVGNMPVPKAEEYVRKLMQQYWSRKNFDSSQNRTTNVYDPQSMLDAYWFTKRGQSEGTTVEQLAGGCLAMDTKIPLLDGRKLSLTEMTEEFKAGKQNWVYSCDPKTGHVVPGKVDWAGVTQESAQVMRLTFNNGKSLVCTPDHKFPTIFKGKLRADELVVGDSIYSTKRQKQTISMSNRSTYEQVYHHDTKEWEFTHRMVANYFRDTEYSNIFVFDEEEEYTESETIHHMDVNRYNNNPDNLAWMDHKDHTLMHACMSTPEMSEKISKGIKRYIDSLSPEEREARVSERMALVNSEEALRALIDVVKDTKIVQQNELVKYLNDNPGNKFSKQFFADNEGKKGWKEEFTLNLMKKFIKSHGYTNYAQFRREFDFFNHTVTKIEYLDEKIQVGTLTIDNNEEFHGHHTYLVDSEVFTYNSNLGQLEDLMYFVKKLYRTLKVPQERLDPADPFKDGDSITREELRFARFIIRIQQQVARGLKESFITHLKLREKTKSDPSAKSVWEKYKLREHNIVIEFNQPSSFAVMREQQIFDLKKNNFTGLASTELMSQSYCQKYYLGLNLEQMAENREWLRKDAALSWEVQQIVASGPDFRKRLAAEANINDLEAATGAIPGGGGSALPAGGPGGFAPDLPPEFGPGPEGGTAEGGEPAAQGAAAQAPAQ